MVDFQVEYFTNFVLWFSINLYWWGWGLYVTWKWVQCHRLQLGNMEHGMDSMELGGKSQSEGVRTWCANDLERAQVLLRQFLRWSSGFEESGFDENLVTTFEQG